MIDNTNEPQENDWNTLLIALRTINENAVGFVLTSTEPTASTTPLGKIVIYDNGSGTKRLYVRTGQENIGYMTLT